MKSIRQPMKITNLKEVDGQAIIQAALPSLSKEQILKYNTREGIQADILLIDSNTITHEQRKKLYATISDLSDYTGYAPEYLKELFKFWYCAETGQEHFSLSNCSLEVARELINYVVEFALMNDIPLAESALNRTDDITKYLYSCIKAKKCCICGNEGIVYSLDKDKNKMCLCDQHHDQAKVKGLTEFCEAWKVYGIQAIL